MTKTFPRIAVYQFVVLFLLSLSVSAQTPDTIASFWSAITPTHVRPADTQKVNQLILWCQQQRPPAELACQPAPPLLPSQLSRWLHYALHYQANSSPACEQQWLDATTQLPANSLTRQVTGLLVRAMACLARSEYRRAGQYSQQALRLSKAEQPLDAWARLLLASALHNQETKFPLTYQLLNQAQAQAHQLHDPYLESYALSLQGLINRRIYFGASLKAVPYHQAALKIGLAQRDTLIIVQERMLLALNYEDARQLDQEVDQLLALLPMVEARNLVREKARLMLLSKDLLTDRQQALGESFLRKGLQYSILIGDTQRIGHVYGDLFDWLLQTSRLREATVIANRYDSISRIMDANLSYSSAANAVWYRLAKRKGDRLSALAFLEKEYQGVGQHFLSQQAARLSQWETIFRTLEQAQLLQQSHQHQTNLRVVISLITLLLLTAGVALYFQIKSKRAVRQQMALAATQAVHLQNLDAAKSRFFANVSHELRTPLTLMMGPVRRLLEERQLSSRQAELLHLALRSGQQLDQLVNDILELGQLELGQMQLELQPTPLARFFRHQLSLFETLAQSRHLHFQVSNRLPEEAVTQLDQTKCRQILNNLLANAVKFTPPGGQISVTLVLSEDQLHLSVADTGPGIHLQDLPHLFERYFQTTRPDKPAQGGTGIGLALCQEYCQLMGGSIRVESTLGQGSVFRVRLPLIRLADQEITSSNVPPVRTHLPPPALLVANELETIPPPVDRHKPSRPTLLVVEDNPDLQAYLGLLLGDTYNLVTAHNGQQALDQLQAYGTEPGGISLVLSDIMMPVMDGHQLLEHLKNQDTTRHLPVIMLTARADSQDKLRALRVGVDDYLLKPFAESELLARIENLLANRAARQQALVEQLSPDAPHPQPVGEPTSLEPSRPLISQADQDWLASFEQHVQQQLANPALSVPGLAHHFTLSESTLLRQLKRLTGLTPVQYLQAVRLEEARRLLESRKGYSLAQVVSLIGYHDVRSFRRSFQTRFGKLPSELPES